MVLVRTGFGRGDNCCVRPRLSPVASVLNVGVEDTLHLTPCTCYKLPGSQKGGLPTGGLCKSQEQDPQSLLAPSSILKRLRVENCEQRLEQELVFGWNGAQLGAATSGRLFR